MKKDFLVPILLTASLNCQAGDYFFEPVFNAKESYYSNIRLLQNPPQDNWVSTLSPGVNFGLRHENGELKSNFTWNQLFYTNESDLNISEQLFSVGYQHKGERLQWGTSGYYNNQSNLNTQGTVLGGFNFTQVMAKQLSLAPTVSYAIDERSSLSFDYSYNKTTYEKNPNIFYYSNYDYHQMSGTFNHLYTDRDKLNVTLSGSRYNTAIANFLPTYNEVAQLGWQHSFSEQLVTYVSAGINYSQAGSTLQIPAHCVNDISLVSSPCFPFRFVPASEITTKNNNFGQVFQGSVKKSFERGSVALIGSRNQTPTSQGLQTSTSLSINNAYAINERWTSGLTASYSSYKVTAQTNSPFNRTYFTISPNINWEWTPEISLALSYDFVQQDYQNSDQPSQGNIVQLQFNYQPQINYNYQVK